MLQGKKKPARMVLAGRVRILEERGERAQLRLGERLGQARAVAGAREARGQRRRFRVVVQPLGEEGRAAEAATVFSGSVLRGRPARNRPVVGVAGGL